MRTIAIVNQKGGCGKTTTAINLAAVLARRGRRTLLVDMDPQSHCAAGLGVPESSVTRGVGEILLGDLDRPLDGSTFLWEVSRNLHLAPSTVSLAALEAASGGLSSLPDRDRRLARMLAWLEPRFDLCIVDCPPTIGLLTFNALRAAQEAIVPVETGYFSFRGAEKQIATILKTAERLGRPLPFRLLATLYDESRQVDREVIEQLRKRYGAAVLPMAIGDHEVLREAASVGQAVTEYAPNSAADIDFEALAAWLLDAASSDVPAIHPDPTKHTTAYATAPVQLPPRVAPTFAPRSLAAMAERSHHVPESPSAEPKTHRQHPAPVPVPDGAAAVAVPAVAHDGVDVAIRPAPIAHPDAGGNAPPAAPSTRAAELARRVRDLSARPTPEELAMLQGPSSRPGVDSRREVRVAVQRGLAFRVAVAGDFNGWMAEDLVLHAESGLFEIALALTPGRYRYRLHVDGREALDPTNRLREVGPDGRDVSVLVVTRS